MKKLWIVLCAVCITATGVLAGCGSRGGDAGKDDSSASGSSKASGDAADEGAEGSDEIDLVQFKKPGDDDLVATIKTSMGEIKVVLYPQYAPKAVQNFYEHATNGYYNGITFHRVIDGFMIQTGDPKGDGTGGESIWNAPFEDEFTDDLWNFRGALSMANSGKNTNGSQFFFVQSSEVPEETMAEMESEDGRKVFPQEVIDKYKEVGGTPWLDHVHTVFGQVVSGMDTVDKIAAVEADENDKPLDKVIIESIEFNKKLDTASSESK